MKKEKHSAKAGPEKQASEKEAHPSEQGRAPTPETSGVEATGAAGSAGVEAAGSVSAASAPQASSLVEELEQLRRELAAAQEARTRAEAELAEANQAKLRALAELENFRRRTARQLEEDRRYALFPLVRDLLPVLDNLRRAVESAQTSQDASALLAGVQLVHKQLQDVLQRHHCMEIEALGAAFDPHLHEAVGQTPTQEHPPGTIIHVAQAGFRLHDRVVRPSLVVVAAAPAAPSPEEPKGDHPPSSDEGPQPASPPTDGSSST
jgi:molecular chaperone GrpE